MTTTFDPSLAMASTGTLPPDQSTAAAADPAAASPITAFGTARGAMDSATARASELVAQRPVASLVIAAGAGALAGWLVKR